MLRTEKDLQSRRCLIGRSATSPPNDDPDYARGTVYWKRLGANIFATELTAETLNRDWLTRGFYPQIFPTQPKYAGVSSLTAEQTGKELQQSPNAGTAGGE